MVLRVFDPTVLLPRAWRMSPVRAEGGFEARRLVQDDHPFGGLAVQGTEAQCLNAAWIIEIYGPDNLLHGLPVEPLRRRPIRSDGPSYTSTKETQHAPQGHGLPGGQGREVPRDRGARVQAGHSQDGTARRGHLRVVPVDAVVGCMSEHPGCTGATARALAKALANRRTLAGVVRRCVW